jgi:serine/threonine protein kinase
VDAPEEVILPVRFEKPGKLGIRFRAKRDDIREELAWVDQVLPGGLAAEAGIIMPGLVLVTINGEAAKDMTFAEQTSFERLSVRPLELGFRPAEGEVRDPRHTEGKKREMAAADLISTACQAAADQQGNNEAVRAWKQAVVQAEQGRRDAVELTEAAAEALLQRAKALMDRLKQSLELDPMVRAAIFLYEPSIHSSDEEPITFSELQARVAAAEKRSIELEWLQERADVDVADHEPDIDRTADGEAEGQGGVVIGAVTLEAATSGPGPIAAMGAVLSDEQMKTVRNVVAAWVEEMVLQMEGGQDGSRGGALLWRCCGTTMRGWLPGSTELEATLAAVRSRDQSDAPFEIRSKLIAADGWQSAVDELNRMDGGGLLGPAAAAAAGLPADGGGVALVDPPLPPAEMLSAVLAAIAAIYAAPTSTESKLDAIGADDLMPVLSYVMTQCSVGGDLGICAEWIQKLADPPLLMDGQPAYYFISFCSALNYLARYKDAGTDTDAAADRDGDHRNEALQSQPVGPGGGVSVAGMGAAEMLSKRSATRRGVIECGLLLAQFANTSTPTPRRRPKQGQLQGQTGGPSSPFGGGGGTSSPASFRETVSQIFGTPEGRAAPLEFEEPTEAEKNADGKTLIGKRVYVVGLGVGVLTGFHKVLSGSSSHSLKLESGAGGGGGGDDGGRVVLAKLQRKMCPKPKRNTCSCCPDKLPWLIAATPKPKPSPPPLPLMVSTAAMPSVEEGIPPERTQAQAVEDDDGLPPLQDGESCRNTLGVCTVVKRRLAGVALRAEPAETSEEIGRLGAGAQVNIIRIGPGPEFKPWRGGSHWITGLKVNHRPQVRTVDGWLTLLPDTLVAHTEPLTLPVSEWAGDESTTDCTSCQSEFGVFVRRHHCRYCGQLFCDDCSSKRYPLASHQRIEAASPETVVEERVCTHCYMFLDSWLQCAQKPYAPDDFEDVEMDSLRGKAVDMRTPLGPESYEPLCTLGIGGVGKVFLAKLKPDTDTDDGTGTGGGGGAGKQPPPPQQLWAVKTMDKARLLQQGQHIHALEEMRLMRRLVSTAEKERSGGGGGPLCPYLLPLSAAFHSSSTLYLVMPFMAGGDLHQAIQRHSQPGQQGQGLPEAAVRRIAAEITLALEALHSLDIVFRDLKPMNVLLSTPTGGKVQLSDFGLAKEGVSRSLTQTTCGTPLYMSPEQVQHATMAMMMPQQHGVQEDERGGYSFAVDWWALGTLIFEALTGRPPFVARQVGNIMHKIANKEHAFPPEMIGPPQGQGEDGVEGGGSVLSAEAVEIVAALLQKDADRRLGAEGTDEVQAHPWFAPIDFLALGRTELPPIDLPTAMATGGGGGSSGGGGGGGGAAHEELSALLGCFDQAVTREPVDPSLFQPEAASAAGATGEPKDRQRVRGEEGLWAEYEYMSKAARGEVWQK